MSAGQGDAAPTSPQRPRVLVVEDDADNRWALRELLEAEGLVVVGEAADGQEGVQLAQRLHPDLVLMDIRMPVMGGIEATQIIRSGLPLTKVIVLTTYDDPSLRRGAAEAGASDYIVKGGPAQLIRDAIFEALGSGAE